MAQQIGLLTPRRCKKAESFCEETPSAWTARTDALRLEKSPVAPHLQSSGTQRP